MKISAFRFVLLCLFCSFLLSSCLDKEEIKPNDSLLDANQLHGLSSTELDFAKKWSLFLQRPDGEPYCNSYIDFYPDRSACYWEMIGETRRNKKTFAHWELVYREGYDFSIMVTEAGGKAAYEFGRYKMDESVILKDQDVHARMKENRSDIACE